MSDEITFDTSSDTSNRRVNTRSSGRPDDLPFLLHSSRDLNVNRSFASSSGQPNSSLASSSDQHDLSLDRKEVDGETTPDPITTSPPQLTPNNQPTTSVNAYAPSLPIADVIRSSSSSTVSTFTSAVLFAQSALQTIPSRTTKNGILQLQALPISNPIHSAPGPPARNRNGRPTPSSYTSTSAPSFTSGSSSDGLSRSKPVDRYARTLSNSVSSSSTSIIQSGTDRSTGSSTQSTRSATLPSTLPTSTTSNHHAPTPSASSLPNPPNDSHVLSSSASSPDASSQPRYNPYLGDDQFNEDDEIRMSTEDIMDDLRACPYPLLGSGPSMRINISHIRTIVQNYNLVADRAPLSVIMVQEMIRFSYFDVCLWVIIQSYSVSHHEPLLVVILNHIEDMFGLAPLPNWAFLTYMEWDKQHLLDCIIYTAAGLRQVPFSKVDTSRVHSSTPSRSNINVPLPPLPVLQPNPIQSIPSLPSVGPLSTGAYPQPIQPNYKLEQTYPTTSSDPEQFNAHRGNANQPIPQLEQHGYPHNAYLSTNPNQSVDFGYASRSHNVPYPHSSSLVSLRDNNSFVGSSYDINRDPSTVDQRSLSNQHLSPELNHSSTSNSYPVDRKPLHVERTTMTPEQADILNTSYQQVKRSAKQLGCDLVPISNPLVYPPTVNQSAHGSGQSHATNTGSNVDSVNHYPAPSSEHIDSGDGSTESKSKSKSGRDDGSWLRSISWVKSAVKSFDGSDPVTFLGTYEMVTEEIKLHRSSIFFLVCEPMVSNDVTSLVNDKGFDKKNIKWEDLKRLVLMQYNSAQVKNERVNKIWSLQQGSSPLLQHAERFMALYHKLGVDVIDETTLIKIFTESVNPTLRVQLTGFQKEDSSLRQVVDRAKLISSAGKLRLLLLQLNELM